MTAPARPPARMLARVFMLALLPACGSVKGLGGEAPALATFQITASGDLASLRPPGDTGERALQVALVWADQWLTEPFCILPPESADAAAVIAAGCRDPFGFVPLLVAANTPITLGTPTTIALSDLPSSDVLVGSLGSRVAYGSLVLYDDRDGDGTLGLSQPHRAPSGGGGPRFEDTTDSADLVYGASFVTMTAPDQRVAFSEGTFDPTAAFYPRSGCAPPNRGYSVLTTGGFSAAAGLASAATGQLPAEDPATCAVNEPADAVFDIGLQAPATLREVACTERTADGSIRYREPPAQAPDLTSRLTACAHLPAFDAGTETGLIQFVVSGRLDRQVVPGWIESGDRCQGLTHYTLRGCRENVSCPVPDWDFTANPPSWWPCP